MKTVDVSMFFNEIELLSLRLKALKHEVDKFIVIESSQTFTGNNKDFVLPRLQTLKQEISDEADVVFISRTEQINGYDDLVYKLNHCELGDFSNEESHDLLAKVQMFAPEAKNLIHFMLDRYQRECCRIYIKRYTSADDIVIFSDADELPDNIGFIKSSYDLLKSDVYSLYQRQFIYNPNLFEGSWQGSLVSTSENLLTQSLDHFRKKINTERINTKLFKGDFGYHLTCMGGIEKIREKIMNWGHQEYNNQFILRNLEKAVSRGEDIFMRNDGSIVELIEPNEYYSSIYLRELFDCGLEMAETISSRNSNVFRRMLKRFLVKIYSY